MGRSVRSYIALYVMALCVFLAPIKAEEKKAPPDNVPTLPDPAVSSDGTKKTPGHPDEVAYP